MNSRRIKNTAFLLLTVALTWMSCKDTGQPSGELPSKDTKFECGHMIGYEDRLKNDREFQAAIERIEAQTKEYLGNLERNNFADFRSTVVTIPVVVHVVYKNGTENISDAKIQSQIDALNEFFRRANTDVSTVPSPFNTLAADVMIQFELAKRDPNCMPTTGITRTATSVASFANNPAGATPQARNAVKFTASGGQDGWPSDQYLNLWSCDLAGSLIGYAAFPADMSTRPAEDGVVMDFMAVGTVAPVFSTLNLGRVCGHEVGHWLNLRHIWGDENACVGTDFVGDTPNQASYNSGCPTFPTTDACSPNSPGVMFMNQMDYTDDACRRMFTFGQSDRMAATLFTVRNSLLSSQGAIPPPASATADLWMRDDDNDIGNEPNNETSIFYISDDIWVRQANDGLINQENQPALGGGTNYVYVKVRNRGCQASSAGAMLELSWAKASAGLNWPSPWDGTASLPTNPSIPMGQLLGSQVLPVIAGNGFAILTFTWNNTPDPSDYASLINDLNHFCLLARIVEPGGMTIPEVNGDLWGNVKNNNNIVWKNTSISDTDGPGFVSTLLSNYTKDAGKYQVNIEKMGVTRDDRSQGRLFVKFDERLTKLIKNQTVTTSGLKEVGNSEYVVAEVTAKVSGLEIKPLQQHVLSLRYETNPEQSQQRSVFEVNVTQIDERNKQVIGGQLIRFKRHLRR